MTLSDFRASSSFKSNLSPSMVPDFSTTTSNHPSSESSDLNCPVCFETYDSNVHAPVFARHCRHSICRTCLSNMNAHNGRVTETTGTAAPVNINPPIPSFSFGSVGGPPEAAAALTPPPTTTTALGSQPTNPFAVRSHSRRHTHRAVLVKDYLMCPTCRERTFEVGQEPNYLAISLLHKMEQMKQAHHRRRLIRGTKLMNDPVLKKREKQLLASAQQRFDEIDLFKEQLRSLQGENSSLRSENWALSCKDSAKERIIDILLKEKDVLLKSLAIHLANAYPVIATLQSLVQNRNDEIENKTNVKEAQVPDDEKPKTILHVHQVFFVALVVFELFCFSIIIVLLTSQSQRTSVIRIEAESV